MSPKYQDKLQAHERSFICNAKIQKGLRVSFFFLTHLAAKPDHLAAKPTVTYCAYVSHLV